MTALSSKEVTMYLNRFLNRFLNRSVNRSVSRPISKIVWLLSLAVVLSCLVLSGSVGASPADPPAPAPALGAAAELSNTISYQGQLTDATGNPLTGNYNLAFQWWDDLAAGSQVGADIFRDSVGVAQGLFTVGLDAPTGALNGQALWLRIGVNGQWLSPRQPLLAVPYALGLRPGATVVGDGAEPFRTLTVSNLGMGAALRAEGQSVAIHALGTTAIKAEGAVGVLGTGDVGVRGITTSETGVEGLSDDGVGVRGSSTGNGGKGVVGSATGYSGIGVEGQAQFGTGVSGAGEIGVRATSSVGFGLQAEGPMGISASASAGDGLTAETSGDAPAAAVRGSATTDAFGGHFTSAQGTGVMGTSTHGFGVAATSTDNVGLSASAGTVPTLLIAGKTGAVTLGEDYGVSSWGGQVGGVFGGQTGVRAVGSGSEAVGVWGGTNATFGLYTDQQIFTGQGCVGCSIVLLARNDGDAPLQVGDAVLISGIAPPLNAHQTPRLCVRRAFGAGRGLLGVVQSRATADVKAMPSLDQADRATDVAVPAASPGPVGPGDGLFVVVQGLAQVRVSAGAEPIAVGDRLAPAGDTGTVQALAPGLSGEVPLGYALEPVDAGSGLVWALLVGR